MCCISGMSRFWSKKPCRQDCRYGCCILRKTVFCHSFLRKGHCRRGDTCGFAHGKPAWLEDKDRSWWYSGRPEREAPAGPLKRTLEQANATIVDGREVKKEEHSGSSMDDLVAFACEGMPEDESAVPERKRPRFVQCKEEPVEPFSLWPTKKRPRV